MKDELSSRPQTYVTLTLRRGEMHLSSSIRRVVVAISARGRHALEYIRERSGRVRSTRGIRNLREEEISPRLCAVLCAVDV